MTPRQLPDRPNLEQLKKQAKSLLHAAQAHDAGCAPTLRRAARVCEQVGRRARAQLGLALHDAQSVIAREHGFASWNALREEVEARTLSFDAAVDEFIRCATGGASRPRRAAARAPSRDRVGVAAHRAGPRRRRGGRGATRAIIRSSRPSRAGRRTGSRCSTRATRACTQSAAGRVDGLVAIARRLCALGRESECRVSLELASGAAADGVVGARSAPSATCRSPQVLLEAGANPTDGVSVHIAGGGGNVAALDLLHRFGVNVNGIPGGVPPLVYMMSWATDPAGPRWLLEHGADPNLAWGQTAKRRSTSPRGDGTWRWSSCSCEHGADPLRRRADGCTPHTLAELHGNHDDRGVARSRTARRTSFRRSSGSSPPARAAIAPAPTRCSPPARACAPSCVPSTTSCCIARPKAATPRCSRRCSRADSIRTRGTRTASRRSIARRWRAIRRPCACCWRSAPTSTRSTACSRRRRSSGPSKDAVMPRPAPTMSASRAC